MYYIILMQLPLIPFDLSLLLLKLNFSWLAEPDDGPSVNSLLVNKLFEKLPYTQTPIDAQWRIGATTSVSSFEMKIVWQKGNL